MTAADPEPELAAGDAAQPRERSVLSISLHGHHRVTWRDWGDPDARETVLCIHGLTRNSHDFDALAARLARERRVICPDLAGRGRSDWLGNPNDYHIGQYNVDMTVLTAGAGVERFDWIGTSLGGLMGITLAGMPSSPVRRLVINDIAPEVPSAALRRVTEYMVDWVFPDLAAVEAHLRKTLAPFGPMTDANWAQMARTSVIEHGDGLHMAFDPGILENFRRWSHVHINLWHYFRRIECPVLIVRGTESDFLTAPLLEKMQRSLPHAEVIEFEGVGHTPTLNAPVHIDPIVSWLRS